ncbi:maleylpyruvate isomerase family mycothiol-dependent enzyme [Streptomyces alfalfae]|uniref:Mycothiol maleylpyruvate isomerase n=1 Tax=Streptomyces alfalfae TaxID=1642299 RepID=A0ABM6GYF6_9ACTN|nr:maleylpyruvate isomerase family mycothiol-dependent enzyme [Streptomyces alfalfae]AYA19302.1 maleylpyruvate isomerase family mycothiol-dependent enzyme [Streptomyces fradiae]APY88883.1 mycothiol maleylpyruvate isomerase [Streptomyces alfalfae]QUI31168.1 maleylpyruvate isomerase family mycothiol-dependent enzyme [Streptomyces alfalfae]RXX36128.1 maleylpyruvate isomerase family mycothiol-dependent enzyme [Streptomyces alfalfae]RZN03862.1 maleylpyruvate isomerase family mycothiol-dependent enz
MIDHVRDLASVRDATDRLLSAASKLNNDSIAEPSRLPGWTRGHVLAHLARNADALVNVLAERPMYESARQRDSDIERDAPRPLAEQLDDVRESMARFEAQAALPADWSRTITLRNGVTDSASRVPFRRWVEVELHHVDLGIGYELEDLPTEFVRRETAFLTARFSGNSDVPPTRVTDGTHAWSTGRAGEPEVTVSGAAPDLVGWLAGRRDGSALTAEGGLLPSLPPL